MENNIEYNIYDTIYIYLTGYGPFLTVKENPAEKISSHILKNSSKFNTEKTFIVYNQIFDVKTDYVDINIYKLFDFIKIFEKEKNALNIIISLGVAENRKVNTLETKAQNHIYDGIIDEKIDEKKNEYYFSKNPVKKIIKAIQSFNNSECKFSNDAGTYLCNYMYFTTLTKCLNEKHLCSFFLHVPLLENYSMEKQENFFRNLIDTFEGLYLKGNEEKRKKILELEIDEENDEHIDEWNKKDKEKEEKKEKEDNKDSDNNEKKDNNVEEK